MHEPSKWKWQFTSLQSIFLKVHKLNCSNAQPTYTNTQFNTPGVLQILTRFRYKNIKMQERAKGHISSLTIPGG